MAPDHVQKIMSNSITKEIQGKISKFNPKKSKGLDFIIAKMLKELSKKSELSYCTFLKTFRYRQFHSTYSLTVPSNNQYNQSSNRQSTILRSCFLRRQPGVR